MLVSAAISNRGIPRWILRCWRAGLFEMVVSRELLEELETVLLRENFRRYLTEAQAMAYVAVIERGAAHLLGMEPGISASRDPDDDYLVNLAWESRADCLVSGDGDLLELEGEDLPRIWTPRTFLEELEESLPGSEYHRPYR